MIGCGVYSRAAFNRVNTVLYDLTRLLKDYIGIGYHLLVSACKCMRSPRISSIYLFVFVDRLKSNAPHCRPLECSLTGFMFLMNAFPNRSNHNRSAKVFKETKKLHNSPGSLESSAKGGKTAERAHAAD